MENMPLYDEVNGFARELARETGYSIAGESRPSRVVLLKKA
ncbi:unnamed protein product [marine sediment metagenome]|uniref:tRNA wybutosine-synthesis domain-containing protein n=1 Tax=marine sediment metagenome TaxID=412755 RepID=X1N1J2_9ZZZZ